MAAPINPLFTGLKAIFTADTGSGGLNESGDGTARVFHFLEGDEKQPMTPAWPFIKVELRSEHRDATAKEQARVMVDMLTYTLDDTDPTRRRAVTNRIDVLFDQNASLAATGWDLDGIRRVSNGPAARRGQWHVWRSRFVVHMTEQ